MRQCRATEHENSEALRMLSPLMVGEEGRDEGERSSNLIFGNSRLIFLRKSEVVQSRRTSAATSLPGCQGFIPRIETNRARR